MSNAVTVYTKPNCGQCTMTKKWLDKRDIPYTEFNVITSDNSQELLKHVKDVLGFSSLPVVEVEGMDAFNGFDPDKLEELEYEYEE